MPWSESQIRIFCFLSIMAVIAVWELMAPRRHLMVSKLESLVEQPGYYSNKFFHENRSI